MNLRLYVFLLTLTEVKVLECVWVLVSDGFSNFKSFPGPTPYAFHTRIPSPLYSTVLIKLTSSTFKDCSRGVADSHRVTLTTDTPPEERITSDIWAGVSISLPEFRWTLICDLIVAAFLSQGPFPPWGSEKSRRFMDTPNCSPRTRAHNGCSTVITSGIVLPIIHGR